LVVEQPFQRGRARFRYSGALRQRQPLRPSSPQAAAAARQRPAAGLDWLCHIPIHTLTAKS